MFIIAGSIRFPVENIDAARAELNKVVIGSRAEAGCEAYAFAEDVLEPGLFHVSERWADRAALATHKDTPHFVSYRAATAALGVHDRNVRLYEVDTYESL